MIIFFTEILLVDLLFTLCTQQIISCIREIFEYNPNDRSSLDRYFKY